MFNQPANEKIPMVMEPTSRIYEDPVVVLDFRSLYPSMMIAYNMCYSTCLGKLHIYMRTDGSNMAAVTCLSVWLFASSFAVKLNEARIY